MTAVVPSWYPDLWSNDRARQNAAYTILLEETTLDAMTLATTAGVGWTASVWDDIVARLSDPDNHNRSIAAQLLCRFAAAEPDRIIAVLPSLVEVTRDDRFVTARHCLQSMWRIGAAGQGPRDAVVVALIDRFRDCEDEKNTTLIRADIIEALAKIYDIEPDEHLEHLVLELIDTEDDDKYRTKYLGTWRTHARSTSSE